MNNNNLVPVTHELVPTLKTEPRYFADDVNDLHFESQETSQEYVTTINTKRNNINYISDSKLKFESQEIQTTITTKVKNITCTGSLKSNLHFENQDDFSEDLVRKIKTEPIESDEDANINIKDLEALLKNKTAVLLTDELVAKIKQEPFDTSQSSDEMYDTENKVLITSDLVPIIKEENLSTNKMPVKNILATVKKEALTPSEIEAKHRNEIRNLVPIVKREAITSCTDAEADVMSQEATDAVQKDLVQERSSSSLSSNGGDEAMLGLSDPDEIRNLVPIVKREAITSCTDAEADAMSQEATVAVQKDLVQERPSSSQSSNGGYKAMLGLSDPDEIRNLVPIVKREAITSCTDAEADAMSQKTTDAVQKYLVQERPSSSLSSNGGDEAMLGLSDPDEETNDCEEVGEPHSSKPNLQTKTFENFEESVKKMLLKTKGQTLLELVPVIKKLNPSNYKVKTSLSKYINQEENSSSANGKILKKRKRPIEGSDEELSNDIPISKKKPTTLEKKKFILSSDSDVSEDESSTNDNGNTKRNVNSKKMIEKLNKYIKYVGYDKTFSTKNSIVKKENGKKCSTCKICKLKTDHQRNFRTHMFKHSGEKPYLCKMCNKAFTTQVKVRAHLRTHLGLKLHKCKYCNYECGDSGNLNVHMRVHTGEKPFKCTYCDYSCRQAPHIKKHLRTHTNDKPYKCKNCDYCCVDNTLLKLHMRIHTKEKPYKCESCNYSCTQRSSLVLHTRTHSKYMPYKCNDCSYEGRFRTSIIEHVKRNHLQAKRYCNECNFSCKSREVLLKHKNRKH